MNADLLVFGLFLLIVGSDKIPDRQLSNFWQLVLMHLIVFLIFVLIFVYDLCHDHCSDLCSDLCSDHYFF
ncbi:hypothetical protein GK047_13240 [Paenibacillus sp. SYP-B3998]|uniref:Uncharacterized protein n=1 Tax=Paenibacillus sp. SYP-B3998 TaxID=2678564 RepID=A0A6G3ZZG1_9BACL|nr:hypothetical protein [Paenibacillus sp. SYP-B3998]NEW06969.1 hypothetical protein [Paenibacillus sp. SYP-B3998]